MPLTPETLTRHELNGLPVAVVEATNPDAVGIAGRVVVETMKTLHVDCGVDDGESRVRQVPKRGATFEFAIPAPDDGANARTDEAAGGRKAPGSASEPAVAGEDAVYVTVDGARLLSRPALRTENAGETTWR
ncbi:MAG: ribonuclease P protein component 1 [Haloferacaceae archaeon]